MKHSDNNDIIIIFDIVKLGLKGYILFFFIISIQNRLWGFVKIASSRRFQRVPTIYVLNRNMKNIRIFYLEIIIFWWLMFQYI